MKNFREIKKIPKKIYVKSPYLFRVKFTEFKNPLYIMKNIANEFHTTDLLKEKNLKN